MGSLLLKRSPVDLSGRLAKDTTVRELLINYLNSEYIGCLMTEDEDSVTFGEFLDNHYRKFAVMGIFGTVSVFLSENFPGGSESLAARSAIFVSLVVFAATAFWICYKTIVELFEGIYNGTRSIISEFGFAVIILCTGTLAISIGSATTTYSEIIRLATPIAVVSAGIILYANVFPIERYNIENASAGEIAYLGLFLTLYIPSLFSDGVSSLSAVFEYNAVRYAVEFFYLALLHLVVSESILGVFELSLIFKNMDTRRVIEGLKNPDLHIPKWSHSISVAAGYGILMVALIVLIKHSTGPGQLYVFGYSWQRLLADVFLMYNIIAVTGTYSIHEEFISENSVSKGAQIFNLILIATTSIFILGVIRGWIGEVVISL